MAEYVVVPSANVRRVAPDTDPAEGAAFTLSTLTAWRMLDIARAAPAGEHVLIWGIGGGVALACLQIAKLLGAHRDGDIGERREARARRRAGRGRYDQPSRRRRRQGDAVAHGQAWRRRRRRHGRRGDVVAVARRARAARPAGDVWRHLGPDGDDRRSTAVLESVEHPRLDDGQRRRVRRRRRALPSGPASSASRSRVPARGGREAFERMASAEQFGKLVVRIAP